MTALRASFLCCCATVAGAMLLVTLVSNWLHHAAFDPTLFDPTLAIPFTLAPIFVWFAFVPRLLEFSDSQLHVGFWLRPDCSFNWSDLQNFGPGRGLFVLRFGDAGSLSLFSQAYPSGEWAKLKTFLQNTYPGCASGFWSAPWSKRGG